MTDTARVEEELKSSGVSGHHAADAADDASTVVSAPRDDASLSVGSEEGDPPQTQLLHFANDAVEHEFLRAQMRSYRWYVPIILSVVFISAVYSLATASRLHYLPSSGILVIIAMEVFGVSCLGMYLWSLWRNEAWIPAAREVLVLLSIAFVGLVTAVATIAVRKVLCEDPSMWPPHVNPAKCYGGVPTNTVLYPVLPLLAGHVRVFPGVLLAALTAVAFLVANAVAYRYMETPAVATIGLSLLQAYVLVGETILMYAVEKDQRASFVAQRRRATLLVAAQLDFVSERCHMERLLPPLLRARVLTGTAVERSEHAAVVLLDVDDFPTWFGQQLPSHAAVALSRTQIAIEAAATEAGIDRVFSSGDSFTLCSNLLRPIDDSPAKRCVRFAEVLAAKFQFSDPILRCAIGAGPLLGLRIGKGGGRYHLIGAVMHDTFVALQCARAGLVVVGAAVVGQASPPYHFLPMEGVGAASSSFLGSSGQKSSSSLALPADASAGSAGNASTNSSGSGPKNNNNNKPGGGGGGFSSPSAAAASVVAPLWILQLHAKQFLPLPIFTAVAAGSASPSAAPRDAGQQQQPRLAPLSLGANKATVPSLVPTVAAGGKRLEAGEVALGGEGEEADEGGGEVAAVRHQPPLRRAGSGIAADGTALGKGGKTTTCERGGRGEMTEAEAMAAAVAIAEGSGADDGSGVPLPSAPPLHRGTSGSFSVRVGGAGASAAKSIDASSSAGAHSAGGSSDAAEAALAVVVAQHYAGLSSDVAGASEALEVAQEAVAPRPRWLYPRFRDDAVETAFVAEQRARGARENLTAGLLLCTFYSLCVGIGLFFADLPGTGLASGLLVAAAVLAVVPGLVPFVAWHGEVFRGASNVLMFAAFAVSPSPTLNFNPFWAVVVAALLLRWGTPMRLPVTLTVLCLCIFVPYWAIGYAFPVMGNFPTILGTVVLCIPVIQKDLIARENFCQAYLIPFAVRLRRQQHAACRAAVQQQPARLAVFHADLRLRDGVSLWPLSDTATCCIRLDDVARLSLPTAAAAMASFVGSCGDDGPLSGTGSFDSASSLTDLAVVKAASTQFATVEAAAARWCATSGIVTVEGDSAMVVGPLVKADRTTAVLCSCLDMLSLVLDLRERGVAITAACGVDLCVVIVHDRDYPDLDFVGKATTRSRLVVAASSGGLGRGGGVMVSESFEIQWREAVRCQQEFSAAMSPPGGWHPGVGKAAFQAMPSWRIRGLGVVRLLKLL